MAGIFISYRRSDTLPWAGRLFDDLTRSFGKQQVFMDINGGIPRGANFEKVLTESLAGCDAMLALIGPTWATCARTDGTLRLAVSGDWVRNEIATALRRGVPLVPVLLGGAQLPDEQAMPDDLRGLLKQQKADVADTDWHHHVAQLIADLASQARLDLMDVGDLDRVILGIDGLSSLVKRDQGVAAIVGRSKEVIENTYRQVERLELFKSIHDSLHTIELECLRPLLATAGVGSGRPFKFVFDKEARRIRKALESNHLNPALKDEIADALASVDEAFQATKDAPGEASAARIAGELNALVSGPPTRLDVAISDAARDLSLERLVGLMDDVCTILGSNADKATLPSFVQGIEALHRLRDELSQRTREHGQLQSLDSKLRTVCLGGASPGTLSGEWARVKRVRARLTGPGSSELQEASEEWLYLETAIDEALAAADERRAFELVRDYFRAVVSVFRDVDNSLKEFSLRLTAVNQALKAILDVLNAG